MTADRPVNGHPLPADLGSVISAVRQAALELLESLPGRPERLRVCAADVTIDVDWRPSLPAGAPLPPSAPLPYPTRPADPAEPAPAVPPKPADQLGSEPHYVCAPSVGTFYHAPAPGAAPFITEGATVDVGQQVGIVEAMKLMLPVEAGRAGRVVEVLVPDGQSVDYGERLVAIDIGGA